MLSCACLSVGICIYVCVATSHVREYVFVYLCVCLFICMCIYVCVSILSCVLCTCMYVSQLVQKLSE